MTEPAFDTVIRGGTAATASDVFRADIGIRDGRVAALGLGLPPGRREIDAAGKLVLPGGVDSHAHIEQLSASGLMNADTWESATRSAALGGTTSVIAFAAQHVGMDLARVVEDYAALAARGAVVDYAFHLIIADATEKALKVDIPALVRAGHTSLKAFMTYDRLRLADEALLDVMAVARDEGALVCVHAENHGLIAFASRRLLAAGKTAPKYHAESHPRLSETEAFERVVRFSLFLDQPVMVFHVSTQEGAAILRRARGEGARILAETCPQYLFLTASDLDRPGTEGAKWMCSPPLREARDQEALWRALDLGDLQTVSSDHAPYRYDETGKLSAGANPTFKQIANGMPGLQMRLPLLFDAMVSGGRLGLRKFVDLTATAPARLYGLRDKGSVALGGDADLCVWDPARRVTLSDAMVADNTGFTPYVGRTLTGWPETVLSRGRVIVEEGRVTAEAGTGGLIPRG
ncbi:D-hydantoinase [Methylobacterium crusticola]|uniref:D-hydantoinase n=1 Tax=Methylobacterium crusticola TaxID=1697972 RepID=A0ABQ4R367_9HYPH|nr:dihydropyrimidinase [Methylobacterium crusticola]GJD52118.1 D-hydantoinase [Methylobacterium crusticola]